MSNKLYLVQLSGVKELYLNLVDETTYFWICHGGKIPQEVKQNILDSENMDEQELESWLSKYRNDNDRAQIVIPLHYFTSALEMAQYIKNNNINICGEYEGMLY